MPLVYIESSALVKRYVEEPGTEVMDALFDGRRPGESFATSLLSVLELKSALLRLAKGGKITEAESGELLSDFQRDAGSIEFVLRVDNALLEEATAVLDTHALRTGDALHLATILRLKTISGNAGESLLVVTSDGEILDACRQEGMATLDPAGSRASDQLGRVRRT